MTDTAEPTLTKPRAQREREAAEAETAAAAATNGDAGEQGTSDDDAAAAASEMGLTEEQYQYCIANNIDSARIIEWYHGKPVTGVVTEVANAGAGLEEGLSVAPVIHELGSRASINLDGLVNRVSYKEKEKREAELVRVERFRTDAGMYVDEKVAAKARRDLAKKLEAHRAENGGDVPVPGLDEAAAASEE
jgi:hypothetical protein